MLNMVSPRSTISSEHRNLSLNGQLHEVRNKYHQKYENMKNINTAENNYVDNHIVNMPTNKKKWAPKSCLIVGILS